LLCAAFKFFKKYSGGIIMPNNFLNAVAKRRSVYDIGARTDIAQEKIQEITEQAILNTPSAFNSQSARVVLLFDGQHQKLWNIVMEALRKTVPAGAFSKTEQKINSFAAGVGTILYFEDMVVVEGLQKQYALYKDNFPVWALQSNGMLELIIWTALEQEGLGASLQHYNPLIDDAVKAVWNLPASWKLLAQMPFGAKVSEPNAKTFLPVQNRLKVFK